jgi:hypothetical protein
MSKYNEQRKRKKIHTASSACMKKIKLEKNGGASATP